MNAPRDASYHDDLGESMKDPAEAAAYIEAVMELDDPAALLVALRHVAKAHGMSEDGTPTLSTIHKVLHAVGLRLSVTPAGEHHEAAHA